MPCSQAELWAFHSSSEAITRLTPWFAFAKVEGNLNVEDGAEVRVTTGIWPLRSTWVAQLQNVDPPNGFEDVSLQSPFERFHHRHMFLADGDASVLRDEIEYGARGLVGLLAPVGLRLLFWYRHRQTRRAFWK